jgi:thymidylate synthase
MAAGTESEMTKEEFVAKLVADDDFAEKHGNLRHIYGEMWRRWPAKDGRTVDQVRWLVNELREDPDAHNTLVNSAR